MPDDDLDVLTDRLRRGADGIRPTADVPAVVNAAVRRRRRQRTAVTTLAAGAFVAASAASVWIGTALVNDDPDPVDDTPRPSPSESIVNDRSRPAALFQDFVGGRSRGDLIRYNQVPGQPLLARFAWSPETSGPEFYLAAVAVERYRGTTGEACARLDTEGSVCEPRGQGVAVNRYDSVAAGAFFDRIKEVAPVTADPEARLRGVTWLHDDGWAVSVVVCACDLDGDPLAVDPPLTYRQLEEIASDDIWPQKPE